MRDNSGHVPSSANVAFFDLKADGRVLTDDGLNDRVKTIEWIARHLQINHR